jgi:mono/diheme cytochrome c family protein
MGAGSDVRRQLIALRTRLAGLQIKTRPTVPLAVAALLYLYVADNVAVHAAQDLTTPATSLVNALPANATGEQIFRMACATCHATDGKGSPESVVGFELPLPNGHEFPDFNDCPTNTVEPLSDWMAVAHRGGPIRGLDRHMPAFGDALSSEQIERTIKYLWSFCTDPAWPRGDLNLPRAFFTEKAFPENETVWTMGVTGSGAKAVSSELVYEHRIGSRGQYEVRLPFGGQQAEPGGAWSRGIGDVELALRRTFYANVDRGSIFAVGGAVTLPTGKERLGLGNGFTIVEPFAMWGQIIGTNGFLQVHAGYGIPSDHSRGQNEGFVRTAWGYTLAQDEGFGRAWSPMAELIVTTLHGGDTEWDLVPQVQVSLSKLQHILLSVGVRVPLNERQDRKPQFLTYLLWDWFDGGLFQFWK